jgi:dolichol-phosphate mannosyltransferase
MKKRVFPLVSIVVPAYNEIENLPELYKQVVEVFKKLEAELELLIVDDASTDGTLEWLRKTSAADKRLRFISFSRNFGHQTAVTAGLRHVTGSAVVIMDADLQDPPEVISEMFQRWREGYHIVMGRRTQRDVDPLSKRLFAWVYYRILARLSEVQIPVDSGDFCLMDRKVVDTLNSLPERNRYVRGLRAWIGFKTIEQPFTRAERFRGEPKYSFFKSLGLAVNGLVSFSLVPLRLATYMGLMTGFFGLVMILLVFYWRFFTNAPLVGYTLITGSFLLIGSVQLLTIGIMGEYIGRVYDEVKNRPHYVLKESSVAESAQAISFVENEPVPKVVATGLL